VPFPRATVPLERHDHPVRPWYSAGRLESEATSTLVVAGASGRLGQQVLSALGPGRTVRALWHTRPGPAVAPQLTWRQVDLLSLASAQAAVAGADDAVYLARAAARPARVTHARPEDVDLLLADTFARALRGTGCRRLLVAAGRGDEAVVQALRSAGVPTEVVQARVVESLRRRLAGEGADEAADEQAESSPPRRQTEVAPVVLSMQRGPVPPGFSGQALAEAYLDFLPRSGPGVAVRRLGGHVQVSVGPVVALSLRRLEGRVDEGLGSYEVAGGAFTATRAPRAALEFRVFPSDLGGAVVLRGFVPALPFALYAVTQGLVHQRTGRRFFESLARG
jgi:hypothetical protein